MSGYWRIKSPVTIYLGSVKFVWTEWLSNGLHDCFQPCIRIRYDLSRGSLIEVLGCSLSLLLQA